MLLLLLHHARLGPRPPLDVVRLGLEVLAQQAQLPRRFQIETASAALVRLEAL